jgi:hypothetical protein
MWDGEDLRKRVSQSLLSSEVGALERLTHDDERSGKTNDD